MYDEKQAPAKKLPKPPRLLGTPQTKKQFFIMLGGMITKSLLMKLIISVVFGAAVFVFNVYLISFVNDTIWLKDQTPAFVAAVANLCQNNTYTHINWLNSSLFWFMAPSAFFILFIGFIRGPKKLGARLADRAKRFASSIVSPPQSTNFTLLLLGAAVTIALSVFFMNFFTALVAIPWLFLFSARQGKGLILTFLRAAKNDRVKNSLKRGSVISSKLNESRAFALSDGAIIGFLVGGLTNLIGKPLSLYVGLPLAGMVLGLAVASLFFGGRKMHTAMLLALIGGGVVLLCAGPMVVTVMADDGGWSESGKNLWGLLSNNGTGTMMKGCLPAWLTTAWAFFSSSIDSMDDWLLKQMYKLRDYLKSDEAQGKIDRFVNMVDEVQQTVEGQGQKGFDGARNVWNKNQMGEMFGDLGKPLIDKWGGVLDHADKTWAPDVVAGGADAIRALVDSSQQLSGPVGKIIGTNDAAVQNAFDWVAQNPNLPAAKEILKNIAETQEKITAEQVNFLQENVTDPLMNVVTSQGFKDFLSNTGKLVFGGDPNCPVAPVTALGAGSATIPNVGAGGTVINTGAPIDTTTPYLGEPDYTTYAPDVNSNTGGGITTGGLGETSALNGGGAEPVLPVELTPVVPPINPIAPPVQPIAPPVPPVEPPVQPIEPPVPPVEPPVPPVEPPVQPVEPPVPPVEPPVQPIEPPVPPVEPPVPPVEPPPVEPPVQPIEPPVPPVEPPVPPVEPPVPPVEPPVPPVEPPVPPVEPPVPPVEPPVPPVEPPVPPVEPPPIEPPVPPVEPPPVVRPIRPIKPPPIEPPVPPVEPPVPPVEPPVPPVEPPVPPIEPPVPPVEPPVPPVEPPVPPVEPPVPPVEPPVPPVEPPVPPVEPPVPPVEPPVPPVEPPVPPVEPPVPPVEPPVPPVEPPVPPIEPPVPPVEPPVPPVEPPVPPVEPPVPPIEPPVPPVEPPVPPVEPPVPPVEPPVQHVKPPVPPVEPPVQHVKPPVPPVEPPVQHVKPPVPPVEPPVQHVKPPVQHVKPPVPPVEPPVQHVKPPVPPVEPPVQHVKPPVPPVEPPVQHVKPPAIVPPVQHVEPPAIVPPVQPQMPDNSVNPAIEGTTPTISDTTIIAGASIAGLAGIALVGAGIAIAASEHKSQNAPDAVCSHCGTALKGSFCTECGTAASAPKPTYCTNCGMLVTENFCNHCRTPLQ